MYPNDRRYSKDHEWISVDGSVGTVGITDFAQKELGDIVYVELPEVGKRVQAGEAMGTIESVKAVSEIYAPLGGTVVAVNTALGDAPEKVNQDPHGSGWLCRIELADGADPTSLLDAASYASLVGA